MTAEEHNERTCKACVLVREKAAKRKPQPRDDRLAEWRAFVNSLEEPKP